MDREPVDARCLSSNGVGLLPASFAGLRKHSVGLVRFAVAWKAEASLVAIAETQGLYSGTTTDTWEKELVQGPTTGFTRSTCSEVE